MTAEVHRRSVLAAVLAGGGSRLLASESPPAKPIIPDLRQSASDRVQLAPQSIKSTERRWYPRPIEWQPGRIVTWDNAVVEIGAGEQKTKFDESRVIGFELGNIDARQRDALTTFADNNFSEALPRLIRCVSDAEPSARPPVWRQQWLSMIAAQAAKKSGRGKIALELISQLDRRPLPSLVLSLLPVDWLGTAGEGLQTDAIRGASSPSMATKLVAASWLLRSETYRSAAQTAIVRLGKQSERPRIALLAKQLRYRSMVLPELRDGGLDQWALEWSDLPLSLQTGPLVAIAD
ncbi:MAG: hypothetical protein AAGJ83_04010, partial [Planctomycetota bacterium]